MHRNREREEMKVMKIHDVYGDMNLTNMSYLLDPDATQAESGEESMRSKKEDILIPISELVSFKNHPFKVELDDENFRQLVESIEENGLIYPILVRPSGQQYEIIAGHRRVAAGKEAGLEEIPAIVRELDDYEATILMVHSNFYRDKIKVSEKAKAYRMCMEAEKHQGRKGSDTATVIGEGQDSKRQVYRYIRLSYLSDAFLNLIDDGKLPVNTGVEIAYLDERSQELFMEVITELEKIPSTEQAGTLRKIYESDNQPLEREKILTVLCVPDKPKTSGKVAFKTKELENYFDPGTDAADMSKIILELLNKYKEGAFEGII